MKRTKNIETFRDTEAIVEKNNDELTGLEKVLPSLNIDKSPTAPKESDDIDK